MFLSSLVHTCSQLGYTEASQNYSAALDSILTAAKRTNTLMWVGTMGDCPADIVGQGELLKHGNVKKSAVGVNTSIERKYASQKLSSCHLFLFQQTIILCRRSENRSEPHNPLLFYANHIR